MAKQQINIVNHLSSNSLKSDKLVDSLFASIFGSELVEPIKGVQATLLSSDGHAIVENNEIRLELVVVEEDNYVSCRINNREIAENGNINRIKNLFNAVLENRTGDIKHLFHSLVEWKQNQIPIMVYRYNYKKSENKSKPGSIGFAVMGSGAYDTLVYDCTKTTVRRSSFADQMIADGDLILIKIASQDEKITEQTLADILSDKDEDTMSVKKTKGFMSSLERLVKKQFNAYSLLGGSPDRGLALLIKSYLLPTKVSDAQKLAKILLTGGNTLVGQYSFVLTDFSLSRKTDGIVMAVKPSGLRKMANQSDLPKFNAGQIRVYNPGNCAMKGTIVNGYITMDLIKLMRKSGNTDGLINLAEYRKIYGKGREGEVVILDGSHILLHKTDNCRRTREVAISSQAILRAPLALKNYLMHQMESWMDSRTEEIRVNPLSICKWGYYADMNRLGIKPVLDKEGEIPTALKDKLLSSVMEGKFVNGTSEYIFFDDSLQRYEVAVPKSWMVIEDGIKRNVKVGDRIYMMAYPLLYGSETAFSLVVERIHNGNYVLINSTTAAIALRDEDGDKPIFILPEQLKFSVIHQDTRSFSTKTNEEATYTTTVRAYCALVSDVGSIDNLVTNVMLWLNGKEVETPTKETVGLYLSKCIQAMIERKKHIVDSRYDENVLRAWAESVLPSELFESPEGVPEVRILKHHPILKTIKSRKLDSFKKNLADVPSGFIMKSVWDKMVNMEVGKEGFVSVDLYREWAQNVILDMMDNGYVSRATIEAIDKLFQDITASIPEDASFDDRVNAFRSARDHYRKACGGSKKHMTLLYVLMVAAYQQYIWMSVCDNDFLANMAGELFRNAESMIKFNGRNIERVPLAIEEFKSEFHATPNKKYVMVVNGMSRKLANGEVSKDQVNEWLTKYVNETVFFEQVSFEGQTAIAVLDGSGNQIGFVSKDSIATLANYTSGKVYQSAGYCLKVSPIVNN